MNIIPIQQSAIGDRIVRTVDARTLHANLEVGRDFSTWIKGRIDDYGFVEDEDFMTSEGFPRNGGKPLGGRPTVEYTLSTQMAKELAMLENNEIGRRVRRYFIASEEELQHMKEIEHKAQLKALQSEHDEDLEIAAHKINMPSRYWLKDVIKAQKQADLAEGAKRYAEVTAEVQAEVLAVLKPMLPDLPRRERRDLEAALEWMDKTLKDFKRGRFVSTSY